MGKRKIREICTGPLLQRMHLFPSANTGDFNGLLGHVSPTLKLKGSGES